MLGWFRTYPLASSNPVRCAADIKGVCQSLLFSFSDRLSTVLIYSHSLSYNYDTRRISTILLTSELLAKLFHCFLLIMQRQWCPTTDGLSASSVANRHVSEPYSAIDLTAESVLHPWLIARYYVEAIGATGLQMPIEPSVCSKTLHSMYKHSVKCI